MILILNDYVMIYLETPMLVAMIILIILIILMF